VRVVAGGSLRTPFRMVRGGGTTAWNSCSCAARSRIDVGVDIARLQQRRQEGGEAHALVRFGE
jgi:hypothetical protein